MAIPSAAGSRFGVWDQDSLSVLIAARCGWDQLAANRCPLRKGFALALTFSVTCCPGVSPLIRRYHQHGQPRPS